MVVVIKFQYLQSVPLHCFIGFGVIPRALRVRYFQLHDPVLTIVITITIVVVVSVLHLLPFIQFGAVSFVDAVLKGHDLLWSV
jgi:hypothetical protein